MSSVPSVSCWKHLNCVASLHPVVSSCTLWLFVGICTAGKIKKPLAYCAKGFFINWNGVSGTKFETTSRHIQRKLYKYLSPVVFWTRYADLIREKPHGRPRRAAAHARRLEGRSQGSALTRLRTCSQGRRHLIATSYARPAGRSRPPSASVQRRKLFPAPTAKNKLNWFNSIKYLPALASGAPRTARGAGLFLISILG